MKKNRLKIFITGSNGFIGRHLRKALCQRYFLLTPSKKKLNLNNRNLLKKYLNLKKPEIIIHLASSTKFKKRRVLEKKNQFINTFLITKNLVDALNPECKFIIFFGSIEEYGNINNPFDEEQSVKPDSYYGFYKYKSLKFVQKNLPKKKINYLWLRPSLTYGFNDNKNRFLGYIISSIKQNKKIIISPGNQVRDFLYIDDLCKILKKFINSYKKKYNFILNISSMNYIKLNKILLIIQRITKKTYRHKILFTKYKNKDLLNSNKKLIKFFPKLKFTTFDNGLRKTLKKEGII